MRKVLFIRTDANREIGWGHVMRCLALGQAWQDAGGSVVFAMAMANDPIIERLRCEGIKVARLSEEPGSVADARATVQEALAADADWVVVDGYRFGGDYQQRLKDSGFRLLYLDDFGTCNHYWADFILNPNLHATDAPYCSREPYTQLLLGTRFALLRREFVSCRPWNREIPDAGRRLLITMGGGDPENVTLRVLQALSGLDTPGLEAVAVVGESHPQEAVLADAAAACPFHTKLKRGTTDMPALMAWADVAIAAGGSSCWELAFMKVPSVVLVLAENQESVARHLALSGACLNLGVYYDASPEAIAAAVKTLLHSPDIRSQMAESAARIVDGEGAQRVATRLYDAQLRLRRASWDDRCLLWKWVNDPGVREVSFSSSSISAEQHLRWFRTKLEDPRCMFFIATNDKNEPVGQVRVDINEEREGALDISIDAQKRGRGYGPRLLAELLEEIASHSLIDRLHAFVRTTNTASIRLFERAGFTNRGPATVDNQPAVHLEHSRVTTNL